MANFDTKALGKILEGFRNLPDEKWDQCYGRVYQENMSGLPREECGACVGAWISVYLGLPLIRRKIGDLFWGFAYGSAALSALLKLPRKELCVLLCKHGAALDPFSDDPWNEHPYKVLHAAILERTGYNHEEHIPNAPIPVPLSEFTRRLTIAEIVPWESIPQMQEA